MKILILTDIVNDNMFYSKFTKLITILKSSNHLVQVFNVNQVEVSNCLACFGCWVKTPGICNVKDHFFDFLEKFHKADKMIIYSSILWGCYSYKVKNYIERLLINMLPFFEERCNKMYHVPRYVNIPEYIMIGYIHNITEEERKLFVDLVKSNIINIKQNKYTAIILTYFGSFIKSEGGCLGADYNSSG